MFFKKKTSALSSKTLLSGIAGISLVLGMSLAPVSFDFQGGQLVFKSIAAYASEGDNESDNEKPATSESDNEKPAASESDSSSNAGNTAEAARELADRAMELAGNTPEAAQELAGNSGQENSHDQSNNGENQHASQETDTGNDSGNDAGSVTPNAAPLALSEFISSMRNGTSVTSGAATESSLNLSYANGWKEEIVNGRYVLVDPNGNTIISRSVRTADIAWLRSILQ